MRILGVIPVRYQSSRFPGKPLANIHGKTMVQRVYEQASQAGSLTRLVVATDDERIYAHVKNFGNVVMTSATHPNGTSRCAEALQLQKEKFDEVINIQGDEPFIHPGQIDLVAECLEDATAQIATLVKKIENTSDFQNPSVVKVVLNNNSEALYFSRSPIPYPQTAGPEKEITYGSFFKHIGIYGYKSSVLLEIIKLLPGKLETIESLEQLRWLEHGYRIKVRETEFETQAVDTPEDLVRVVG